VTSQSEFIRRLAARLERFDVAYMVVGSYGSGYHGEIRATNDIDIVVEPDAGKLESLLASFGADFYADAESMREAVRDRSMFNVIELESAWKADLIARKDRPFSLVEFARRRRADLLGAEVWMASPEDVMLAKLEWAKMSGSDRQLRDVRGVATVQWSNLDFDYLRRWAKELSVEEGLETVLREADELRKPPAAKGK